MSLNRSRWILPRLIFAALAIAFACDEAADDGASNETEPSLPRAAEGTADVNGTSLRYEDRGSGPPLVLLQGGQLTFGMWDDQFAEFSERYHVLRYDVRGFGQSGRTGEPYQAHEDLAALLDDLGIASAYLVGLSLGGRIAIDFALAHPERADALVLAGPGLSGFPWSEDPAAWVEPLREAAMAGDSVRAALLWLESPYMAPAMEVPELAPRLRELAVANATNWVQADTEIPLDPPAVGRLGEIRAPTLILVGTRDMPDILGIADTLEMGIPGARKVVFEGAGHMLNLERPQEFNRVVLEFLAGVR